MSIFTSNLDDIRKSVKAEQARKADNDKKMSYYRFYLSNDGETKIFRPLTGKNSKHLVTAHFHIFYDRATNKLTKIICSDPANGCPVCRAKDNNGKPLNRPSVQGMVFGDAPELLTKKDGTALEVKPFLFEMTATQLAIYLEQTDAVGVMSDYYFRITRVSKQAISMAADLKAGKQPGFNERQRKQIGMILPWEQVLTVPTPQEYAELFAELGVVPPDADKAVNLAPKPTKPAEPDKSQEEAPALWNDTDDAPGAAFLSDDDADYAANGDPYADAGGFGTDPYADAVLTPTAAPAPTAPAVEAAETRLPAPPSMFI